MATGSEEMKFRIAFAEGANEINAGGRIPEKIKSKFQEGVALLVFRFSDTAQFGRRRETEGHADAREGAR